MDMSSAADTDDSPSGAVDGADQIADQFDVLASANRWFDDELHLIYASRTPLSQSTVNRLVALGERMRPAAEVRTVLPDLCRVEERPASVGEAMTRCWMASGLSPGAADE